MIVILNSLWCIACLVTKVCRRRSKRRIRFEKLAPKKIAMILILGAMNNIFHSAFTISVIVSDLRLKFMTALMLIVLAISITIMVLRFGVSQLQDNLMSEMTTHYQNSAEFLSFYGLLNFYLYTMAFVYSPSKNAAFGRAPFPVVKYFLLLLIPHPKRCFR